VQGRAITRFGSPPLVGALALALALALAFALAGATAAGAAPRGRVIRVEREPVAAPPRICIIGGGHDSHLCFGQPRAGERVTLLSSSEPRVRSELVIESVADAADLRQANLCASDGAQLVKGRYTPGTNSGDSMTGLRGAQLDAWVARVLTGVPAPSGSDDEQVKLAVDSDGNGSADLVVTTYPCTPEGALVTGAVAHDARCIDTYMARRGKLHRVHQDIIRACR
jgi:hypothetical protein